MDAHVCVLCMCVVYVDGVIEGDLMTWKTGRELKYEEHVLVLHDREDLERLSVPAWRGQLFLKVARMIATIYGKRRPRGGDCSRRSSISTSNDAPLFLLEFTCNR
uniref:Uncharacterized protein n=1 Tax=Wuchereria bancrofti TaxID=6293 RepID=A0A1I8EBC3_WUCBA